MLSMISDSKKIEMNIKKKKTPKTEKISFFSLVFPSSYDNL